MVAQALLRAGFDFMRLRADVGEVDEALASWWQEFQQADDDRREDLMAQAREEQRQRQKVAALCRGVRQRLPRLKSQQLPRPALRRAAAKSAAVAGANQLQRMALAIARRSLEAYVRHWRSAGSWRFCLYRSGGEPR